jgi:hypothetical protein
VIRPDVIPIPLRADVTAHVHIPLDLTEAEARKIAAVVLAYASADTLPKGQDAQQGLAGTESGAVDAEGSETPNE